MAVTTTDFGGRFRRHIETGSANTELVVTVPSVHGRVVWALTSYSAAPTQAGVTAALDAGGGAGYDGTLNTGSANARYTYWTPTDLVLNSDDAVTITAPAGGAAITASVTIVVERIA